MPLVELNVESVHWAKQTAKGTPATTADKLGRKVAGDLATNRADGGENYSDGQRLSSEVTFVDTMAGGGSPGFQAQPSIVGHLAYLWAGTEGVAGTATNAVQTLTVTGGTPVSGSAILTFDGQASAPIAFNTTASAAQAILERMSKIGKGNIAVTGGPWPGTGLVLTFQGELAASPVPAITSVDTFSIGDVTVAQTTVGVAVTHTVTPGSASFWTTWWKKVGASAVLRQRFNDCRVSGLQINGGNDQKVVRVTPTVISLDPGEIVASDPVKTEDPGLPMIYTEAANTINIDGTVFRGVTGFNVNITDALTPAYGDLPTPMDVASGTGQVEISDVNVLLETAGLGLFFEKIYGTATPATGAKPITSIPVPGSFEINLWRTNTAGNPGRQIKFTATNVQWSADGLTIAGNPDGGIAQLTLSGRTRKVGADPHFTLVTKSADIAYV